MLVRCGPAQHHVLPQVPGSDSTSLGFLLEHSAKYVDNKIKPLKQNALSTDMMQVRHEQSFPTADLLENPSARLQMQTSSACMQQKSRGSGIMLSSKHRCLYMPRQHWHLYILQQYLWTSPPVRAGAILCARTGTLKGLPTF